MGTYNPVVSMIMKMYCKLVKVQVEPGTLRIKIGESFRATDVRQCNITTLKPLTNLVTVDHI